MRVGRPLTAAPAIEASAAAPAPATSAPAPDGFQFQSKVRFGDRVLSFAYKVYEHSPFGHRHRAKADARAAMTEPLTTPARLGDVTIVANGLLNLEAPAATLFRLARYTNGPVVIASNNPTNGNALNLRELEEIEGVPVPAELRGKLFIIGDEAPHITPWTDATALLAQQLEVLNEKFPGLADQKVSVLGYSQGALSAMAARQLKPGLIDRVISLSGALEGTQFAENRFVRAALGAIDDETGRRALDELRAGDVTHERAVQHLGPDLVDLAYGASADGGGDGVEPFFGLTRKLQPRDVPADGVITTVTPDDARHVVVDAVPKTHLRVWQDWRTVDTLAQALPREW